MKRSSSSVKTHRITLESLGHVLYEIWMLSECTRYLVSGRLVWTSGDPDDDPPAEWIVNVVLEAALVHTRLLWGFFGERRNWHDDQIVADYVPGFPSRSGNAPNVERMNKEIAHLSFTREHDRKKKEWNFAELFNALRESIDEFLKRVAADPQFAVVVDSIAKTSSSFSDTCKVIDIGPMCPTTSNSAYTIISFETKPDACDGQAR